MDELFLKGNLVFRLFRLCSTTIWQTIHCAPPRKWR